MKIILETEGGVGYFPHLNQPIEVDTEILSPEDSIYLKNLVDTSNILSIHTSAEDDRKSRDKKKYKIRVDDSGIKNTVTFTDGNIPPDVLTLIHYLRKVK